MILQAGIGDYFTSSGLFTPIIMMVLTAAAMLWLGRAEAGSLTRKARWLLWFFAFLIGAPGAAGLVFLAMFSTQPDCSGDCMTPGAIAFGITLPVIWLIFSGWTLWALDRRFVKRVSQV